MTTHSRWVPEDAAALPLRAWGLGFAVAVALLSGGKVQAHGKPHAHGVARADLALEGAELTIAWESPLDNVLGFERAPRNDAERRAAAELLQWMRTPAEGGGLAWVQVNREAQCRVESASVRAPVLEPSSASGSPAGAARAKDHADLEATATLRCAQPERLQRIHWPVFDRFARLQRIELQWVDAQGQRKWVLKRPQATVTLRP